MSLDVYLEDEEGNELYSANITHNLNKMAKEAGIYEALWRPEEIGVERASQLSPLLEEGLKLLLHGPAHFKKLDAPNGWGTWRGFLPFVAEYYEACHKFPDALVRVSR